MAWRPKANAKYTTIKTKSEFAKEMKKNGNRVGIILNKDGSLDMVTTTKYGEAIAYEFSADNFKEQNSYSTLAKAISSVKGDTYFVTADTTIKVTKKDYSEDLFKNAIQPAMVKVMKSEWAKFQKAIIDAVSKNIKAGKFSEAHEFLSKLVKDKGWNTGNTVNKTFEDSFYGSLTLGVAEIINGRSIPTYGQTPAMYSIIKNAEIGEVRSAMAEYLKSYKEKLSIKED
jgi:hypothetical protein